MQFPYPSPIIAPFNADIDFLEYEPAFLSYRMDTSPEILTRATDAVMSITQYAQELPNFQAARAFVATWHDVVFLDALYLPPNPRLVSLKITHSSHISNLSSFIRHIVIIIRL